MKKINILILYIFLLKNIYAKNYSFKENDFFLDNSKITQEFLEKNMSVYIYRDKNNNDVDFSILLPKDIEIKTNKIENINNYLNKEPLLINKINFKNNKNIEANIYLFYYSKEFNLFDLGKVACIGKYEKCNYVFEKKYNSNVADILLATNDNQFFMVRSIRNGNFYYVYSFFIENESQLLKNKKDILISMNSFKMFNPIKNFEKQFQFIKIDKPIKFTFALPLRYKYMDVSEKYTKIFTNNYNDKIVRIDITSEKYDNLQLFVTKQKKDFKQKEFLATYLTYLKFLDIEIGSIKQNVTISQSGNMLLKIKCKRKGVEYELYTKVLNIDGFLVLVSAFNIPENVDYIRYIENKEVLNIVLRTINFN